VPHLTKVAALKMYKLYPLLRLLQDNMNYFIVVLKTMDINEIYSKSKDSEISFQEKGFILCSYLLLIQTHSLYSGLKQWSRLAPCLPRKILLISGTAVRYVHVSKNCFINLNKTGSETF